MLNCFFIRFWPHLQHNSLILIDDWAVMLLFHYELELEFGQSLCAGD